MIGLNYVGGLWINKDSIDITDPSYNKDVTCRMLHHCIGGRYGAFTLIDGETGRVATLSIYRDNVAVSLDNMKCIGQIGVDSARAGFFVDKPNLSQEQKDLMWSECHSSNACLINQGGLLGVFSMSGWGDGYYNVFANDGHTAFTIVFLEEYLPDEDLPEEE